jgi:hypothetical protein
MVSAFKSSIVVVFLAVANTCQLREANSLVSALPMPLEHPLISTTGALVFMIHLRILRENDTIPFYNQACIRIIVAIICFGKIAFICILTDFFEEFLVGNVNICLIITMAYL